MLSSESEEGLMEMSLHPPHMINSEESPLPAAFIPFCAYQSNVLGVLEADLPFTSCSLALPTVLDGQLCYSINISNIAKEKTKSGGDNGLLILLDSGPSKTEEEKKGKEEKAVHDKENPVDIIPNDEKTSAKVYVQTLSGFSSFGEGDYAVSALKKMKGTQSFLDFPNDVKKCQIESRDNCRILEFFESVQDQCGCVPWELMYFTPVRHRVTASFIYHIFGVFPPQIFSLYKEVFISAH